MLTVTLTNLTIFDDGTGSGTIGITNDLDIDISEWDVQLRLNNFTIDMVEGVDFRYRRSLRNICVMSGGYVPAQSSIFKTFTMFGNTNLLDYNIQTIEIEFPEE